MSTLKKRRLGYGFGEAMGAAGAGMERAVGLENAHASPIAAGGASPSGRGAKRARPSSLSGSAPHSEETHKELEAEVGQLRHQCAALRSHCDAKQGELTRAGEEVARLQERLGGFEKELERTMNENRILKRAVTIQNTKQKEMEGELHARRAASDQAAEYVRRLEQANYALSVRLQTMAGGLASNDFMGQGPPDVY